MCLPRGLMLLILTLSLPSQTVPPSLLYPRLHIQVGPALGSLFSPHLLRHMTPLLRTMHDKCTIAILVGVYYLVVLVSVDSQQQDSGYGHGPK